MKRLQIEILCALLIVAAFYAGTRYRRNHSAQILEKVVVDTVFYERPAPARSSSRTVSVNVPRWLFAPAVEVDKNCQNLTIVQGIGENTKKCANNAHFLASDVEKLSFRGNYPGVSDSSTIPGNLSEILTGSADSVRMFVELETRIYEDSLYRAQVSGPALGDLRPTLDWVQVYNRTQIQTVTKRHRFAVTAGAGAAYTPQGFQPTVGLQVGVVIWGF